MPRYECPASPFRRRLLNLGISMDVICPGAPERCVNSVGGDPHHGAPGVRSVQWVVSPQAKKEDFCGDRSNEPVSTMAINEHAERVRRT
jgi:hypothetical protein